MNGCISTLSDTTKRDNYDTIIEEESSADLLIECVEFLCIVIGEKEMYEIYAMFYRNLLVQVAFLMMKTSKTEFEQMSKDPEQLSILL